MASLALRRCTGVVYGGACSDARIFKCSSHISGSDLYELISFDIPRAGISRGHITCRCVTLNNDSMDTSREHKRELLLRRAFTICLRTLREKKGISQENLALESDINRGYMSGMERGRHSPTLEMIYKFLPALGVTFTEFAAEFERSVNRARREVRRKEGE
jgi:ribosome-binding protein aMBF1 (putative translation factor)